MLFCFVHNGFPNHINRNDKESKCNTGQPAGHTQAFNAQHFATESNEYKLQRKNGKHDPNECLIAVQALKGVDVARSCIETIKGNSHHEYCEHGRLQISKINIAKQIADRLDKEDTKANEGDVQCANQNLNKHFLADNACRAGDRLVLHVFIQCRFTTKCNSSQGIHCKVNQQQLDNSEDDILAHNRPEEAGEHSGNINRQLENQELSDALKHCSTIQNSLSDGREVVIQNSNIASFLCNFGAAPHCKTNVRLFQCGGVINAITGHTNNKVEFLCDTNQSALVGRKSARNNTQMLQCLPMEKFPRWRKALRANKPVVISDLQRLEKVYPDEAAFFREYGVTTLLAAPFSKRINQGFIAVDDPTRYTDDPVFLFIASYAVVVELNEIKQQQSLLAATKASKYNPEDIHINFFGGMEIISSKGTLTGEDIKADQCYLLLAYLILNHKKNFSVDTLAEIICPYDELDSPYKVVNNIVYRLRRTLSVIGLDKLVIGKNGTFQINPNFNIHTDFDRFEDACIQLKTEENPDMRHSLYHSAVDIYKGQLLPRCEHELWLMQLSMYYQSLYLQITKGYVRLKMECKDYILAQKTAIDALRFDPKDSELNMYAILAMGFQGNLSMAQTYYTAAKPYLALEHAEVIKKYLHIK